MAIKKKEVLRQCIGCREQKRKKEMVRILKTPEDEIIIDTTGKKNGRGAYLCLSIECFEKAVKSRGIESSFKCAVSKDVYDQLSEEMRQLAKT